MEGGFHLRTAAIFASCSVSILVDASSHNLIVSNHIGHITCGCPDHTSAILKDHVLRRILLFAIIEELLDVIVGKLKVTLVFIAFIADCHLKTVVSRLNV